MYIREIQEADNEAMEQIIKRSLESVGLDIPGTAYYDPELGRLSYHYELERNAKYWVIEDNQKTIVGGIGIAPFKYHKGVCELQKLYITPSAQGQGLSKLLMDTALAFAETHYKACYLETATKLVAANRLYVTFGFHALERPLDGSDHGTMDAWYLKEF